MVLLIFLKFSFFQTVMGVGRGVGGEGGGVKGQKIAQNEK